MFCIAVGGSRFFDNYQMLKKELDSVITNIKCTDSIKIISGHCRGTDFLAEMYAQERGFALELYPAKWSEYGRCAGVIRNMEMVNNSDLIVAFWDGKSKGTKNLINNAVALSKPCKIVYIYSKPPT